MQSRYKQGTSDPRPSPPGSIACPCLGIFVALGVSASLLMQLQVDTGVPQVPSQHPENVSAVPRLSEQPMACSRPSCSLPCHFPGDTAWSPAPPGAAGAQRHNPSQYKNNNENWFRDALRFPAGGNVAVHQQCNADLCCRKPKLWKTICDSTDRPGGFEGVGTATPRGNLRVCTSRLANEML